MHFAHWEVLFRSLWRLGETSFVQYEEFGPCAFGSGFVVDLAAAHRPTVIAAVVNLDRCGEMRCGEGGFECVLGGGIALVVVVGDRTQNFGFHLRDEQVRTVRLVGYETSAMEGGCGTDAVGGSGRGAEGERAAHAVALNAHLLFLVGRGLCV